MGPGTEMRSEGRQLSGGELNAAVARLVVGCYREYLGRGPTKAQAFYRDNFVVAVLENTMTRAEESLAAGDGKDAVLDVRRAIQKAMRTDLVVGVERLTGCKVLAFMSSNHLWPDMASEVFVLDAPVRGHAVV
jgi:uncharacterized protein YbcI